MKRCEHCKWGEKGYAIEPDDCGLRYYAKKKPYSHGVLLKKKDVNPTGECEFYKAKLHIRLIQWARRVK